MKKLKNIKSIMVGILILAMSLILLAGCGGNATQKSAQTVDTANSSQQPNSTVKNTATDSGKLQGTDTDGDGIPDAIEKTYGTNPYIADTDGDGVNDKQDKDPAFGENPIKESSNTLLPVKIKNARVEDNVTADHLEITVTNTGKDELKSFDIYYTITDKVYNKKEAYYQKVDGLSIKSGETKTIHFDNKVKQQGHYFGNMNGLYGTSKNGLIFGVVLHNSGYMPFEFQVEKAKGTAEVAD
ncbi:MAG TPA: hypothetical protein VIK78_22385 [Ruminiclostridium sp.]